jgi:hypothetical protein
MQESQARSGLLRRVAPRNDGYSQQVMIYGGWYERRHSGRGS